MRLSRIQVLCGRLRAVWFGLLLATTALVSAGSAQGVLEDIDPFAETQDVIATMEASFSRLIDEFGPVTNKLCWLFSVQLLRSSLPNLQLTMLWAKPLKTFQKKGEQ